MKKTLLFLAMTLASVRLCVAAPPVMGWSSWNTYRVNISDSLICRQADAMVALGLDRAGYKYINIDDGYFGGRDSLSGRLLFHPVRFPAGLKPVVDHIHSLGLKAGIYSDAGRSTCGSFWDKDTIALDVGLYGHERDDCNLFFNTLGFDFIKVDFCGGEARQNKYHLSLDPAEQYRRIHDAIVATGRNDVTMNVCRWNYPGTWVADVAASWRISPDISSNWWSVKAIIDQSLYLSAFCRDGKYNDMDMLEVGRTLSPEEDRTHFGMWCMMSSPLLIGCDMTTLRPETLQLLKNAELIALNQDPLGLQAYVAHRDNGTYVLVKDIETLYGPKRAVALYNPTDSSRVMTVDFSDVDLAGLVKMRDLMERKDVKGSKRGGFLGSFEAVVPPHGVKIYLAEAEQRLERMLYEAETAFLSGYQEIYNPQATGSPIIGQDEGCSGGVKVWNLGFRPENDILWRNVYSRDGGDYELTVRLKAEKDMKLYAQVNGGDGLSVDVPASQQWQEVTVATVPLNIGENTVRLYNDDSAMPEMDYLRINPK